MREDSRPLGEQERLLHYLNAYGGLMPLGVLHIRGAIDEAVLVRALAWLQRQHPMLRAHVRYGELRVLRYPPFLYRQPYFETRGTLPIPFRAVTGDWEEEMRRELRRPLPRGRHPRLRITLVHDRHDPGLEHLIFCGDHACMDAPAAQMVNRELLEYLADPAGMEARPPAYEKLPPPLEAGHRKSGSGTKSYQPALRLPRQRVPGGRRGTAVVTRRLDAPATAALKGAVRAHRTTLHGAIAGAFLLAMHQRYGLEAMTCLSSWELRRMCKPPLPMDTFGCYIDILRTRHELGPDFWPIARDVSFKLIAAIAKDQEAASFLKVFSWGVYAAETWPMLTHRQRLDGLGITTAGESGLGEVYGNHVLEGMTAAVSLDFMGPSLLVLAAERAGGLDLNMSYATNALPAADARDLADRALATLVAAGQLAEAA